MPELYIGLMSGTSLDGIDAVAVDFERAPGRIQAHLHLSLAAELRAELLALNQPGGTNELHRAALAANALARACAESVRQLLDAGKLTRDFIRAIGCHGQTIRHQPESGYTLQLVNGALLAELAGIDVVCDFRSRDIAAGGQGAPLVPAFHHECFAKPGLQRVVVNIGGIANITHISATGMVTGFDCGPGNILMDAWTQFTLGQPYDRNGAWARQGQILPGLLAALLQDKYFQRVPPKSTGRDLFSRAWLERAVSGNEAPADVQATLLELTARTIADAIDRYCRGAREIYVCGGGARNTVLMGRLAQLLAPAQVAATDELGVDAQHVEAMAFAWLARRRVRGEAGNLPIVTGARAPRVLGAIYRA